MRTCLRCPLFCAKGHLCKSVHPFFKGLGCRCVTWMIALFADPHQEGGCFARARLPEDEMGWPAYRFRSRTERWLSPLRFLLRR